MRQCRVPYQGVLIIGDEAECAHALMKRGMVYRDAVEYVRRYDQYSLEEAIGLAQEATKPC